MAIPDSPIPASALPELSKLVHAQRGTEVATLAAAVVASMNRLVSIKEVLEIRQDIAFALYSDTPTVQRQAWQKVKEERLERVWK